MNASRLNRRWAVIETNGWEQHEGWVMPLLSLSLCLSLSLVSTLMTLSNLQYYYYYYYTVCTVHQPGCGTTRHLGRFRPPVPQGHRRTLLFTNFVVSEEEKSKNNNNGFFFFFFFFFHLSKNTNSFQFPLLWFFHVLRGNQEQNVHNMIFSCTRIKGSVIPGLTGMAWWKTALCSGRCVFTAERKFLRETSELKVSL